MCARILGLVVTRNYRSEDTSEGISVPLKLVEKTLVR